MTVGIVMEMSYATGLHKFVIQHRSCTIRLYYDCEFLVHMDFQEGSALDGKTDLRQKNSKNKRYFSRDLVQSASKKK